MLNAKLIEPLLTWSLRLGGFMTMLAFFAVFLPVEWMVKSHAALGLGEFPHSALTDYMTRSASALYGVHGGILWALSADVRRHLPVVRRLGMLNIVMGLLLVGIDIHAGLPTWWIVVEGPGVAGFGVWLLLLCAKLPTDPA